MGGVFGLGGSKPNTFSQGGNPAAYIPQAQGAMDVNWQNILNNLMGQWQGGQTPAQQFWPQVQQTGGNIVSNPWADLGMQGAQGAGYGMMQESASPEAVAANMFQQIPGILQAGQNQYGLTQGMIPDILTNAQRVYQSDIGQVPGVLSAANQVFQTGMDPRHELYQRTLGQLQDQQNAQLAASGLQSSPYGASVANKGLSDFNIDWQNQQLARQQAGLGALEGGAQTAAGLEGAGFNALQGGYGLGANLGQMGQNALQSSAAAGLGLGQGAQNLMQQGFGEYFAGSQLPYQTSIGQSQAGLGALQNMLGLGNQQYMLPQQLLGDIQGYLGLGQQGSQLAGQLGNQGFQQQQTGLSNLFGLASLGLGFL